MYPIAVICFFWARDSFCVAYWLWLPCHISETSWALAIQCNFFCSASLFIYLLFSALVGSNSGSLPASNLLFAHTNGLTTTCSQRVSPVFSDCLHQITSRRRENLTSTLTPWGMQENISSARLERLAYFGCISSCTSHQLVIYCN